MTARLSEAVKVVEQRSGSSDTRMLKGAIGRKVRDIINDYAGTGVTISQPITLNGQKVARTSARILKAGDVLILDP